MAEKFEWLNKLRVVIQARGGDVRSDSIHPVRQSHSDGSLVSQPKMPIVASYLISWIIGCNEIVVSVDVLSIFPALSWNNWDPICIFSLHHSGLLMVLVAGVV